MALTHRDGGVRVAFAISSAHGQDTTHIKAMTYNSDPELDLYLDPRRVTLQLRPTREDGNYQNMNVEISGSLSEIESLLTRALAAAREVVAKAGDKTEYIDIDFPAPKVVAPAPEMERV